MRSGEAQDLAQFVVSADQLGNRLRQVRRRQWRLRLRRGLACAGALIWVRLQDADLAGKLVTASRDCADQLALGPESSAQRRDLGLQIGRNQMVVATQPGGMLRWQGD